MVATYVLVHLDMKAIGARLTSISVHLNLVSMELPVLTWLKDMNARVHLVGKEITVKLVCSI